MRAEKEKESCVCSKERKVTVCIGQILVLKTEKQSCVCMCWLDPPAASVLAAGCAIC